MPYTKTLVSILCWATLMTAATAGDWPQWQGPHRNAVSSERGLLQEWPKDGPPLAWKIKGLGGGYSAPSIAAGRIFGMSNRGEDEDRPSMVNCSMSWAWPATWLAFRSKTARSSGNVACRPILAGAYQPGVSANRHSLMVIRSSAPPAARMGLWWPSTS